MIESCKPSQSAPEAYAYAAGSYAVRRGYLLSPDDLRRTPAEGTAEYLVGLVSRGSYSGVSAGMTLRAVIGVVEDAWNTFLIRAERDLPEPFLPYLQRLLTEKEYAKAGLAAFSLYGANVPPSLSGPTREYAEQCRSLQSAAKSGETEGEESTLAAALRDGLSVWRAGGSAQDAQTVFDLASVSGTMRSLSIQYGYPAIIDYVDSIADTMIAGLALKAKLRSDAGIGSPVEGLYKWLPKETSAKLRSVVDRVQNVAWESIQPKDLVPSSTADSVPSGLRYTQGGRMAVLAEILDEAAAQEMSSLGSEPYGVGVVFSYMVDFRREVRSLRRQLRSAEARGTTPPARGAIV